MSTIGLPQARIPIAWANIQGQRIPVEVDIEWMRFFAGLLARTGGVTGDNDFGTDIFASVTGQSDGSSFGAIGEMIMQSTSGNVSDKVVVKPGTAAAPSITTENDTDTGISFPAANQIGFDTNGVQRVGVTDTSIGIASLAKLNLDGVSGSGDTYIVESAANVVDVYAGGVKILTITATGTATIGHVTIEGVTSTGATGTGNIVFSNSPTLVTPNLGTPSAINCANATNITNASTTGFSGTKTPPASITVVNGLVTNVT